MENPAQQPLSVAAFTVVSLRWSSRTNSGEIRFADDVDGAVQTGELVAVRGVDEGGEPVIGGELELGGQRVVLGRGHGVVADLADGDDGVLHQIARQGVQDGVQRGRSPPWG